MSPQEILQKYIEMKDGVCILRQEFLDDMAYFEPYTIERYGEKAFTAKINSHVIECPYSEPDHGCTTIAIDDNWKEFELLSEKEMAYEKHDLLLYIELSGGVVEGVIPEKYIDSIFSIEPTTEDFHLVSCDAEHDDCVSIATLGDSSEVFLHTWESITGDACCGAYYNEELLIKPHTTK